MKWKVTKRTRERVCGGTAGFNSIRACVAGCWLGSRASAGAPHWPLTQGSELNTEKSSSIELSYLVTLSKFTLMEVLGWNLINLSIKPNRVHLLYKG